MASLSKTQLIGNLGDKPEIRYTPDGKPVATVSLATTETWKDKNTGEKKEATEWHRVVLFRRLAEVAGQYLKKGSQVYIEGRIRTRKWQDKDGQERYTTEIEANEMKMLGGKSDRSESAQSQQKQAPRNAQGAPKTSFEDMDDEIPFQRHGAGKAWRVI